jgi:hypothetical protein
MSLLSNQTLAAKLLEQLTGGEEDETTDGESE